MECSQGVNDVLPNRFFIFSFTQPRSGGLGVDERESISRGLMSLYWVSEGIDHEKQLRNGSLD